VSSVYNYKPAFQRLLRPLTGWLSRRAITANQVTIAATVLSLIQGIFIIWKPTLAWPLVLMPVTILARLSLNAIDGLLAREHDLASNLGVVLNELGDLISDMVLYLPLAFVPGVPAPLIVVAVCLALMSEATGVIASQISGVRGNQGPMGKSDRALLFGGLAFVLGLRISMGVWISILLLVTIGLLLVTVVNRASSALGGSIQTKGTVEYKGWLPSQSDERHPVDMRPS
jgi:CDP-diacylglycerol--glycerol-3-phosphate 3-phosphatidyltransferase